MKRIIISISLISLGGLMSCKKDLLDINHNPNSATTSTPQLTMPSALEGTARITAQQYLNYGFWTGFYATSSGFAKPVQTYTYDINSTYQAGTWDALYNNLADIKYVETQGKALNLPVYDAIGKILEAIDYQQIVDQWGNAAYTEAMKGGSNLNPKYDEQQFIYEDLVKKLDSAIAIFQNPNTAQTFIFGVDSKRIILFNNLLNSADPTGSTQLFFKQWVRFANTVKLKILLQQTQIPGRGAYITQNLTGLTTASFLQPGEDAAINPGYNTSGISKVSPMYGNFYKSIGSSNDNNNSIRASDYAAKAYTAVNDPRISYYYLRSGTTYVGNVFGDPVGTSAAASIGKGLLDPLRSAPIITASESLFMQAEAVQRGYLTGNAQALYEKAVAESFRFDAQAAGYSTLVGQEVAYLAQPDARVNWATATDKIQLIITQKWYALNGLSNLTVYNDYRRTGFPNAPLSIDPNSKGKVPLRMFYPQNETLYNSGSVSAQGTVDVFSTTIFWDK